MFDDIKKYLDKVLLLSTPEVPYWNIESIKLGRKPTWNYIDGVMLSSLIDLYHTTNNRKYLDFVSKFVDYFVDDEGHILGYDISKYSTDDVCESKVLFDLYEETKNEKYLKAIQNTYLQLVTHPRTKEGNFIHKGIYHDQVWLDGLYMVQPFYVRYINRYLNSNYEDVIKQFKNVRNIMYDEKKHLYYHAYDSSRTLFWADKETGLSKNFWLRSIGWFIVSLIDCIDYMNDKASKDDLAAIFKEAVDGILEYIDDESKMFYQLPALKDLKGNYLETSGSSMIAYVILKGVRLGVLSKDYKQKGIDIFNGVMKHSLSFSNDGDLNIKDICLMAGVGPESKPERDGSVEYYLSEPVVENDAKGVAPFIMAYTEMIKL